MYYKLFNDVFEDNINKICTFEMGAFYIIINRQAVYITELLGLKKVCFVEGVCKVGFPVNSLSKYIKKFTDLGISFVVLEACNMNVDADCTYKLKGYKKKYEFEDERFVFNEKNYICNCNKCSFKKTDIMKDLDKYYIMLAKLNSKICNLELIQDMEVTCEVKLNEEKYEVLMLWGMCDE